MFVPPDLACEHYGVSKRTLRDWFKASKIKREPAPNGNGYWYWVADDNSEDDSEDDSEDASLEDYQHPPIDYESRDYVYDGTRYLFSIKSHRGILAVSKERIEEFVSGYSNHSGGMSINEAANKLGISRQNVIEIKTALGKTHDSSPFTDEQLAADSEDELIADLVRIKENRVVTEAERREWSRVKTLVRKFDRFDRFVADRLQGLDWEGLGPLCSPKPTPPPDGPVVVLSPTDFHAHKYSWDFETGQTTNFEVMRGRLADVTERALGKILGRCTPREFLVGVGSDFFHIDNPQGTTTRGTPQDVDGTWAKVYHEGTRLFRSYVETLAQVAPVTLVNQAGNHDETSAIALWEHMRVVAELNPDRIRVKGDLHPRQYQPRGDNLLVFNHGDGMADAKLAQMPAVEQPELYGRAKKVYIFRGHHHTFGVQEYPTGWVVHMPSLAGTDRWHVKRGYVGNYKALAAYILDDEEGLTDIIPVYA